MFDVWRGVRSLLVVRLDNIGDIILLGPALRLIKERLPEVHITLMASPSGAQAANLLPWVDHVWTVSAVWQDAFNEMPLDPRREAALISQIHNRAFDAAFIFTSFSQSPYPPAYVCYLASVPVRAGMSAEFGGSLLSHWVRAPDPGLHQSARNLYMLKQLGFGETDLKLQLEVPEESKCSADQLLEEVGLGHTSFIAVAPGATCQARRWHPERFAQLSALLADQTGLPVLVIGKAGECHPCASATRVRALLGETSVSEFVHIVGRSALVIANNSCAMHIADAFCRPVLALFSGTDLESQWRPRWSVSALLRRPTGCAPCYRFTCPYHMECLEFSPEEVCQEALKLMR